jgi:hypothetical protein
MAVGVDFLDPDMLNQVNCRQARDTWISPPGIQGAGPHGHLRKGAARHGRVDNRSA